MSCFSITHLSISELTRQYLDADAAQAQQVLEIFRLQLPRFSGNLPKDVAFDVEGEKVEGSLLSLASGSPYFAALFSRSHKEGQAVRSGHLVRIEGVKNEVFRELCRILESGKWEKLPDFNLEKLEAFLVYLDFTGTLEAVRALSMSCDPGRPCLHSTNELEKLKKFNAKHLKLKSLKRYYAQHLTGISKPEEAIKLMLSKKTAEKVKAFCGEWLICYLADHFDAFQPEFQGYGLQIKQIKWNTLSRLTEQQAVWVLKTISPLSKKLNLSGTAIKDISFLDRFYSLERLDLRGCRDLVNSEEQIQQLKLNFSNPLKILK